MSDASTGETGERRLPVHELFHAWQGEGVHAGRAAFFIRTQGCPIHCPWCDAAGTWHPDHVPASVARYAPGELVALALEAKPSFVVVTGGEPAVHDLGPLTEALSRAGLRVHLETSGAFPLRGRFDWVTVSPKWWKRPLPENLARADELKLIVEEPDTIARWWGELQGRTSASHIWLQPEWSRRADAAVLASISSWVKRHGDPFRATWQLHKLYKVDEADPRSRPAVPLGGDPARGM